MVCNSISIKLSTLLLISIVVQLAYGIPMNKKSDASNDSEIFNNELDSSEDVDNDSSPLSKQQLQKLVGLLNSKGEDTRYINQNYQQFKHLVKSSQQQQQPRLAVDLDEEDSSEDELTEGENTLTEKDLDYILARLHLMKKAMKMRKLNEKYQSVNKRNPDSSNAISNFLKMYKTFSHQ